MSHGSTLLVTPCELPTKDDTVMKQPVSSGMKRRNSNRAVTNCPSRDVVSPQTSMSKRKKFRRFTDLNARPSKVRWDSAVICINDVDPYVSNKHSEIENKNVTQSTNTRNEKWYSKAEYKQMMLDQCLTVHIMRSLRSLAGEKVPIDYCDEEDCSNCRFDSLIKEHSIDPEEYCERGLESYLSDERRIGINTTRKLHKLLVISEYDRQGLSGIFDPELVRNASLKHSKKSSVRTRKLALIDQREAQAGKKLNNANDYDQKQGTNAMVEEMVISPDRLCSWRDQECTTNTEMRSSSRTANNILVKGMKKSNAFDPSYREESQFSSERISETLLKQQLMWLLKQEQEHSQRAQSQYHFQRNRLNPTIVPGCSTMASDSMVKSYIASCELQEKKQQEHHRLQLQFRDQCNYEQQVQRLLLLQQQQQHYDAIQMASATILGQRQR